MAFARLPGLEVWEIFVSRLRDCLQRVGYTQGVGHVFWQTAVQGCSFRFVGEHFVADLAYFFSGVAHDERAWRPDGAGLYKGKRTDDTTLSDFYVVHQYAVHSDEAVRAQLSAMDDCPMADVGALSHVHGGPWEHVDDALLLYVATCFQYDSSPVSA